MNIDTMLKLKIGQAFTLPTGEKVKVVNGFSCYEADYLEIVYVRDETQKVYRVSALDSRIFKSKDFK